MDGDKVFRARADPTRRRLPDQLCERNGQTLGRLCAGPDTTRRSASQHPDILVAANLVSCGRRGREKRHFINPVPLTAGTARLVHVTCIHAAAEAVSEAITRPEGARRSCGHGNIPDRQPGSDRSHVRDDGGQTVAIVGKVPQVAPPRRPVLPWTGTADAGRPGRNSRVTFAIADCDDMRLTVSRDDPIPGSGMATGVTRGWPPVLSRLKSLLQTGRGPDVLARPKAA